MEILGEATASFASLWLRACQDTEVRVAKDHGEDYVKVRLSCLPSLDNRLVREKRQRVEIGASCCPKRNTVELPNLISTSAQNIF